MNDSDMVAVHSNHRATSCAQRLSLIVSAFKGSKYNPRRDKARGFAEWCTSVSDALVLDPELCQVFETRCHPPDVPLVIATLLGSESNMTIDGAVQLAEAAAEEYDQLSKELFLILTQLIDLKSTYQEDDLMYIRSTFHRSSHRDGVGLLRWLDTFADTTGSKAQSELALTWSKFTIPAMPKVSVFSRLLRDASKLWGLIAGNSAQMPTAFVDRVIAELPIHSSTGDKLVPLREALVKKRDKGHEIVFDLDRFIRWCVDRYDQLMGSPDETAEGLAGATPSAGGAILGMGERDPEDNHRPRKVSANNCTQCSSWVCKRDDPSWGKLPCLVELFNSDPAKAIKFCTNQPDRAYLALAAKFIKENPSKIGQLKTKKFSVMRSKVNDDGTFKPRNAGPAADGANMAIAETDAETQALEAEFGLAPGELQTMLCIASDYHITNTPLGHACAPMATAHELGVDSEDDDACAEYSLATDDEDDHSGDESDCPDGPAGATKGGRMSAPEARYKERLEMMSRALRSKDEVIAGLHARPAQCSQMQSDPAPADPACPPMARNDAGDSAAAGAYPAALDKQLKWTPGSALARASHVMSGRSTSGVRGGRGTNALLAVTPKLLSHMADAKTPKPKATKKASHGDAESPGFSPLQLLTSVARRLMFSADQGKAAAQTKVYASALSTLSRLADQNAKLTEFKSRSAITTLWVHRGGMLLAAVCALRPEAARYLHEIVGRMLMMLRASLSSGSIAAVKGAMEMARRVCQQVAKVVCARVAELIAQCASNRCIARSASAAPAGGPLPTSRTPTDELVPACAVSPAPSEHAIAVLANACPSMLAQALMPLAPRSATGLRPNEASAWALWDNGATSHFKQTACTIGVIPGTEQPVTEVFATGNDSQGISPKTSVLCAVVSKDADGKESVIIERFNQADKLIATFVMSEPMWSHQREQQFVLNASQGVKSYGPTASDQPTRLALGCRGLGWSTFRAIRPEEKHLIKGAMEAYRLASARARVPIPGALAAITRAQGRMAAAPADAPAAPQTSVHAPSTRAVSWGTDVIHSVQAGASKGRVPRSPYTKRDRSGLQSASDADRRSAMRAAADHFAAEASDEDDEPRIVDITPDATPADDAPAVVGPASVNAGADEAAGESNGCGAATGDAAVGKRERVNRLASVEVRPGVQHKTRNGIGMPDHCLSGLEILQHLHAITHAGLPQMLATIKLAGLRDKVGAEDIREYCRLGCGFCDEWRGKRAPTLPVTDSTPPIPGKVWVWDSLKLPCPSAEHKFVYAHRFIDLGSRLKRTYFSQTQDAQAYEKVVSVHRAFNRSAGHGEVIKYVRDAHSSADSKRMEDYLAKASIVDFSAAERIHEPVGAVEVSWQHDVPKVMAAISAAPAEVGDEHVWAALLLIEHASNAIAVHGSSPARSSDMIYYGTDRCETTHLRPFATPAMVLLQSDDPKRPDKWSPHALPMLYMCPSRKTESRQYAMFWDPARNGDRGGYYMAKVSETQFDEQSVVGRMAKGLAHHKTKAHQALVGDPMPSVALPSDDAAYMWSATSEQGTTIPGAWREEGHTYWMYGWASSSRPGDMQTWLSLLSDGHAHLACVDVLRGGYSHDLLDDRILQGFVRDLQAESCEGVILTPTCSGWSSLRFVHPEQGERPKPPVLFTTDAPEGISYGDQRDAEVLKARAVGEAVARVLAAARSAGKHVIMEHPVQRRSGTHAIAGCEKHSTLLDVPAVASEIDKGQLTLHTFDQCMTHLPQQKTTVLVVSSELTQHAHANVGLLACQHKGTHEKPVLRQMDDGSFSSHESGRFTSDLNRRISCIALKLPCCAVGDVCLTEGASVEVLWREEHPRASVWWPGVVASCGSDQEGRPTVEVRYDADGKPLTHLTHETALRLRGPGAAVGAPFSRPRPASMMAAVAPSVPVSASHVLGEDAGLLALLAPTPDEECALEAHEARRDAGRESPVSPLDLGAMCAPIAASLALGDADATPGVTDAPASRADLLLDALFVTACFYKVHVQPIDEMSVTHVICGAL